MAEKFRGLKSKIENPYGEHGNLFSFTEVTPDLIKKQLNLLDVKKATGLDKISPQFLRDAAQIVCAPLADIFNKSMLKGKIPQSWKNAKVTPIFKAVDPTDVSNYRPISVIPVIMVLSGLCTINLSTYYILYEYQSGFRSKFSTETALIDVTEYIINGFDSGELVGAVMLDLKKAFDTVDSEILTKKLQWFGIKDMPLSWFES